MFQYQALCEESLDLPLHSPIKVGDGRSPHEENSEWEIQHHLKCRPWEANYDVGWKPLLFGRTFFSSGLSESKFGWLK